MVVPDSKVAMSMAPPRLRVSESPMLPAALGLSGSDRSIIWTPLSSNEATAAYVVVPDSKVTMPRAP